MNKGDFAMNEKLFHSDSFICTYCWIGIWQTALFHIGNIKSQRLLDFIFKCIDWTIVSSFVCSGVVSIWCPFLSLYWRSRRTAKFCINEPQYRKGGGGRPFCETFSNWDSFWFPFQPLLSSWCDLWVSSAIVSLVTASHYVLRQRIQVLYAFKRILKKPQSSRSPQNIAVGREIETWNERTVHLVQVVHPCLRPSLPGGRITTQSHVSERFLDFCYFAGSIK